MLLPNGSDLCAHFTPTVFQHVLSFPDQIVAFVNAHVGSLLVDFDLSLLVKHGLLSQQMLVA